MHTLAIVNATPTCACICNLLRSTNRGIPNQQLAYKLWRELFEAYRTNLDGASIRAGEDCSVLTNF